MSDFSPYQEFLENHPLGVMAVARDRQKLKIFYANPAFKKISPLLAEGQNLAESWPGKAGKDLVHGLTDTILPESLVTSFESHWLKLHFQQVIWNGQDAILIYADDISGIKEIEVNLKRTIEDADKLAESKSNFLATMSHEMRTPMQAVFGLLELIALEKPSDHIMEMVDIARNASSGMLEILDDILDLAKIDADKMELDMFEVPIRTLTRGIIEALSVKIKGRPVVLVDEIDDKVPAVILGDPKRLRQILLNLTGNAVKFTDEGLVKIRITTTPAEKLTLRFEIIDSGIGISEEAQQRLFGNFAQADSSTARKYGGTGLGLSISKKLVELMHGRIGVISQPGEGSTFWFEIPTEEINQASPVLDMPNLGGLSVLSVEDHPQGAKEIINSLRSMGATVESCATYKEALELVKRRPFDVGIIDQGLPDGLGLDLIREMMNLRPLMGLFMYTVRNDEGLLHSLQSMGIDYVVKPASRLGLGQKVLSVVHKDISNDIANSGRLLIAEDTPSVQDMLKRQLKNLGVEADFVSNGVEALGALATGNYSILLSDLHMPEMDGYELVEAIRRQEKLDERMPVIVLTADVQMAQRQVYMSHGFDECLLKPVSLGHIKRLLIRWGLLQETDLPQSGISKPVPITGHSSIDMKSLIENMGSFDESAKEMLGLFVEMTAPLVNKIKGEASINALVDLSHSLKGAARSAGATKLGDIAADIQEQSEKGIYRQDLIEKVILEFSSVKEEIRKLIS